MVDLKTNPHQLTITSSQVQDIYMSLEQEIFKLIATRLNTKGITSDNVLTWQIKMLNELHLVNEATIKLLSEATGLAEEAINKLFIDQGLKIYDESIAFIGKGDSKTVINPDIDQLLSGYAKQTFLDIKNTVNQTLVSTNYGEKSLTTDMYQQIIKETTGSVIAGTKTPERALADTIYKWRDKGIKPVLVDKGGNEWGLEGYVRTVVSTTSNRAFQSVRDTAAHDNGIRTFVMSSHLASREACASIQGKLVTDRRKSFTDKETGEYFESLYNHGYGTPGGTFGINCTHIKWPYIPGVNTNNQPQYDRQESVSNGKIQQKQRALERRVREEKRKLELAKELDDEQGIIKYKLSVRKYQSALRKIVNDNNFLGRDYAREKIY
ncbi:phage minor capsid protein [Enterococcus dongliensis]|uniref:Capsid protein n=1 Tax=Enterococcus dongliensis TaxID=2559925 RepID=A0ABU3EMM4_9ENTE|nr:phage minor capsid protein [Enterococcus dongliensis]MDT2595623.1 capsid protein [Enterococcus dongliensis]MDT2646877.1 capsid protein [Enterococcus dongliensis]